MDFRKRSQRKIRLDYEIKTRVLICHQSIEDDTGLAVFTYRGQ